MAAIDQLRKQWREEAAVRPFYSYLHIGDDGLVLGAGTLLAPMIKDYLGAPVLALDGGEQRIIALLSLCYRKSVPLAALEFIKRASLQWAKGEKALAHFELAYARLPRFETREDARHLFYADALLRKGVSACALMLSRGLDTRDFDLLKYSADEPRVPAGSGRESGRWTSGAAGGSAPISGEGAHIPNITTFGSSSDDEPKTSSGSGARANSSGQVVSDVPLDPLQPGQQYAQSGPRWPSQPIQLPIAGGDEGGGAPFSVFDEEAVALIENAPSKYVEWRIAQLKASIPPEQQGRITMAAAVVEDAYGNRFALISTSEGGGHIRRGITVYLDEIRVSGTGHAEEDIVNFAKAHDMKIIDIGATRPVCARCQDAIRTTGARISTPLKKFVLIMDFSSMDRLQLLSLAFFEKFCRAAAEKQRAACLVACELAVTATLSDDSMARETLQQLQMGRIFTESQRKEIESRAFQLDEAYLDLQDKVDDGDAELADSLRAFFKARAMEALAYAVSDTPDAGREAIYEASSAIDGDKSQFLSIVEARLD